METGIEYYNNKMAMRKELRKVQTMPHKVCQDSFELGWEKAIEWLTEKKQ